MRLIIILLAVLTGLVISRCTKDKTAPLVELPSYCVDTISFTTQIKPIFDVNCSTSGCHDSGSAADGKVLETYNQISDRADEILPTIKHDPTKTPMPIGADKLPDSIIQKFECWILQGKLNN